jgi:hypothetical protein
MSNRPNIVFFDGETNKTTQREMTDDELSEALTLEQKQKDLFLEQESKIQARQSALSKLAALGLTEEEIAAL